MVVQFTVLESAFLVTIMRCSVLLPVTVTIILESAVQSNAPALAAFELRYEGVFKFLKVLPPSSVRKAPASPKNIANLLAVFQPILVWSVLLGSAPALPPV